MTKRPFFSSRQIDLETKQAISFFNEKGIVTEFLKMDYETLKGFEFRKDDILFFCYPQPHGFQEIRHMLVKDFALKGSPKIINQNSFEAYPYFNKVTQKEIFIKNGIPTPDYFYSTDLNNLIFKLDKLNYPLLMKLINGSRGKDMKKVESKEEALSYLSDKNLTDFFIEKYIDVEHEGKAFINSSGFFYFDLKTDKSLSKEAMEKISLYCKKITEVFKLDYAGIDFLVNKDEVIVLEVNRSPKFINKPAFLSGLLDLCSRF